MMDLGWAEIVLILILALIFIRPEELPGILYKAGRLWRRIQFTLHQWRNDLGAIMHEAEVDEYRKLINGGEGAADNQQNDPKADK
jgi:Sec-independent protein translocase protein TatA